MNAKMTKLVKKEPKVYESAKTQKLTAKDGTSIFIEKGDRFQLIPVKEQTAESEKLGNDIVTAINNELKDEPIKVRILADDSSNLNGINTTNITFEVFVSEEVQGELSQLDISGVDYATNGFDSMLNEILMDKFGFASEELWFGFASEELCADRDTNTFTVNKVTVEGVEDSEIEIEDPKAELFTAEEPEMDIYDDSSYLESLSKKAKDLLKKSKYVKFIEADDKEDEEDEEDEEADKKDEKKKTEMKKLSKKEAEDKKDDEEDDKEKVEESDDKDADDEKKDKEDDKEKDDKKEEKAEKDKNGKWPFQKGYIKPDSKEDKEDDKKKEESWKPKVTGSRYL